MSFSSWQITVKHYGMFYCFILAAIRAYHVNTELFCDNNSMWPQYTDRMILQYLALYSIVSGSKSKPEGKQHMNDVSCSSLGACAVRAHAKLRDGETTSSWEISSVLVSRLSRNMFRAAVRLSFSGVRSLTRTQPGCQGICSAMRSECFVSLWYKSVRRKLRRKSNAAVSTLLCPLG